MTSSWNIFLTFISWEKRLPKAESINVIVEGTTYLLSVGNRNIAQKGIFDPHMCKNFMEKYILMYLRRY